MNKSQEDCHSYWNTYYGKQSSVPRMMPPSQFAAFVMSEVSGDTTIFDLGCGNARDSIFFAHYGFDVLGFDQSETAVEIANRTAKAYGFSNASFNVCILLRLN